MRHPLLSTRLSGALSIALLLVVSFAGMLHEALVPHVICPEHGESVELTGDTIVRAPTDAEVRAPRVVDSAKGKAAGHEHCDVALLGRTRDLLASRILSVAAAASDACALATRATPRRESSVPLLLLAPKHSPPVIA